MERRENWGVQTYKRGGPQSLDRFAAICKVVSAVGRQAITALLHMCFVVALNRHGLMLDRHSGRRGEE